MLVTFLPEQSREESQAGQSLFCRDLLSRFGVETPLLRLLKWKDIRPDLADATMFPVMQRPISNRRDLRYSRGRGKRGAETKT